MGEVIYRPYRSGDEVEINAGFNEVFGLSRSLDEWRWKFPESPEGRWIMLAVDPGGRVLAHYAAVAMQFRFGREQVRAGQIVDAYSRTEVRGTRVFSSCYERFIEAFGTPEGLPLMFGFPGRRHYEMGLKALKYVPIGSVPYWVHETKRRALFAGRRFEIRHGFDALAVDDLWLRAAQRYDVAAVRDSSWFARRYWGRPAVEYTHLSAWRHNRVHAWAVVRATAGTLKWAELVWDGETAAALVTIDRAVARLARRHSCTSLELWFGGDPAAERTFGRLGWARHLCPQDVLLVARTFETRVDLNRMQGNLYLTMGDSDLV
jgi:hypothetical protein